jgi:hypothetical protein
LRRELRDATKLFEVAATAATLQTGVATQSASRGRRRSSRAKPSKGRVTPKEVTIAVVRGAIVKLGESTASEIAAEITLAGAPVGGRAVRFLAEQAGATARVGDDGHRRYRLG